MSYDESNAYEDIAQSTENAEDCNCYHVKAIVLSMTKHQLSSPNITEHQKEKLQKRLDTLGEK